MQLQSRKLQTGMSLVELMVAMLLSLMLSGAIISVFANNSHSFKQDENLLSMQDDARYALRQLAFDISMAGHYADLVVPGAVTPDAGLLLGTDCGPSGQLNWMYRATDAASGNSLSITAVDNATGAQANAAHSCIGASEIEAGTDIVSIKRVVGGEATGLRTGGVYLRTNGTEGLLFRAPISATPTISIGAPNADWEFRPSIYYIRSFANTAGDGIPTLCRKVLAGGGPSMITECIAEGIEDLQVEYGIDTTDDGHPNLYLPNPSLAQIQEVVNARIFILARTTEIDTRYTNAKTFSVSNSGDYTPADSFHRRVFSTTVSIQNIRSMNMMGF